MKRDFYVFQEDLIGFKLGIDNVTLSEFARIINQTFGSPDMKKLRVESLIEFLVKKKMIRRDETGILIPTLKGRAVGINQQTRINTSNKEYMVNVYSKNVLSYILDNIYKII